MNRGSVSNKSGFRRHIEQWKNLIYIILAIAILIMICIVATSTSSFVTDEEEDLNYWKTDGLLLNHTPGILYGCPSMKYGQLWTFESVNEDQTLKSIDDFLNTMNITGLIFLNTSKILDNQMKIIELHSAGNELGFFIDTYSTQVDIMNEMENASKTLSKISNGTIKAKFARIVGPAFRNASREAKKLGFTVVQWTSTVDFSSSMIFEMDKLLENLKNGPSNGGIVRVRNVQKLPALDDGVSKLKTLMENFSILSPAKCFRLISRK